jgi:hypothetical protein
MQILGIRGKYEIAAWAGPKPEHVVRFGDPTEFPGNPR